MSADAPGGAPTPARVLLVGMMGAGKTTVGRLVADRLGWAFLDTDEAVSASTGRSVPEIFAEEGEAAFRAVEARVLGDALAGPDRAVVSVAGGAVLDEGNRALLRRSGTVVWLRADPATLAARVGSDTGRPLLGDDPAAALASIDAERRGRYEAVASVVVDVDGLAPGEVADLVLARSGSVAPGRDGA